MRRNRSKTASSLPVAKAIRTADESLIFALPPELRRDIKAAANA